MENTFYAKYYFGLSRSNGKGTSVLYHLIIVFNTAFTETQDNGNTHLIEISSSSKIIFTQNVPLSRFFSYVLEQ